MIKKGSVKMSLETENPTFRMFHISDSASATKRNIDAGDEILLCKTFSIDRIVGSFFSCIYKRQLRIHAVLNEETEVFNGEIAELIKASMKKFGVESGTIWFRSASVNLLSYLKERFVLTSDDEQFFYHSTEYIMRKDKFDKQFDHSCLDVKPYDEAQIDQYLELLSDAMSFFFPPEDFLQNKASYLEEFQDFKDKNAFEAFWKGDKLVGLYWLGGIEVDTLGVSSHFERSGYGTQILTRAIERVFEQNPETDHALLYAVGWNAKAQNFYRKYGMEVKNYHNVPYTK